MNQETKQEPYINAETFKRSIDALVLMGKNMGYDTVLTIEEVINMMECMASDTRENEQKKD